MRTVNDARVGRRSYFNSAPALRFLIILAILNLAWELAQLPFYTLWQEGTWREIGFAVAHCTAGDVLIAAFCTAAALIATGRRWPQSVRASTIFIAGFVVFGVTYTVSSEWLNVTARQSWAYSDLMPVIPPLGTGLTPVLQWIAMPVLAFWLSGRD